MNEKQIEALENCDDLAFEALINGNVVIDEYGCFIGLEELCFGPDPEAGY